MRAKSQMQAIQLKGNSKRMTHRKTWKNPVIKRMFERKRRRKREIGMLVQEIRAGNHFASLESMRQWTRMPPIKLNKLLMMFS